jgi:hypothetical protein
MAIIFYVSYSIGTKYINQKKFKTTEKISLLKVRDFIPLKKFILKIAKQLLNM